MGVVRPQSCSSCPALSVSRSVDEGNVDSWRTLSRDVFTSYDAGPPCHHAVLLQRVSAQNIQETVRVGGADAAIGCLQGIVRRGASTALLLSSPFYGSENRDCCVPIREQYARNALS